MSFFESNQKSLFVQKAKLYTPKLEDLVLTIQKSLETHFKYVQVEVVKCPDLKQFGLNQSGIGGKTVLVEVGGVPNLMDPKKHDANYRLSEIAEAIDFKDAFIIGAGATAKCQMKINAEYVPIEDLKNKTRESRVAYVGQKDESICKKYPTDQFGLLGNLYFSQGQQSKVLKVQVKQKIGSKNFVTAMKEGLKNHPGVGIGKQIGMGGVFLVEKGQIKAHIMPDFKKTVMIDKSPEIDEWLKFYKMGPGLTCLTTFITGDPSSEGFFNVRDEHTHFFNKNNETEGGHFHYAVTPDSIQYTAYLNVAEFFYRINNPEFEKLIYYQSAKL